MAEILLVQLSDLHFGKHSRFAGINPAALGRTAAENIESARQTLKIRASPSVNSAGAYDSLG